MDVLGAFVADRCVLDPDAREKSTDLYSAYSYWCEKNDERPMCPRMLGMRLKERGFKQERTNSYRTWLGLTRKAINA
jgi:putative DNA primase/helicase